LEELSEIESWINRITKLIEEREKLIMENSDHLASLFASKFWDEAVSKQNKRK
jgi:regulator of replication initiation timing